ncbi:MAG: hypothetical protein ACTS27_04580 [Phycisphaerales bacterium]
MRHFFFLGAVFASLLAGGVHAAEVPGWAKESLRTGSPVYAAQDVIGTVAPRDLAASGLVWLETDPDFGPGTPGRSRLLLTLAAAPATYGEAHADDSVIRVLLRYIDDARPEIRSAILRRLRRATGPLVADARHAARQYWFDDDWSIAATALGTTAELGGVSSEEDIAMMRALAERPETVNPAAWAAWMDDHSAMKETAIRGHAAFVVLSSSLRLEESVEWAAGLQGDARQAAFNALLAQMLIEDGAFAHAAPDLRIRWMQVFDAMLREIDRIKVNDYALPLWMVMQRHPECAEQASQTLVYLRDQTDVVRIKEGIAQMIRDAGHGDLLPQP